MPTMIWVSWLRVFSEMIGRIPLSFKNTLGRDLTNNAMGIPLTPTISRSYQHEYHHVYPSSPPNPLGATSLGNPTVASYHDRAERVV